ncbi:MAG: asparagine synthase-related protein [Bacteroidales bacterium]
MYVVIGYISSHTPELPINELFDIEKPFGYPSLFIIKEEAFKILIFSQKKEHYQKNKSFIFDLNNEQIFIIAHIHNRLSLIKNLNLNPTAHDSEILFEAYKNYGIEGLKKCFGKWMFISFNKEQDKIQVIRDHLGMFNYYYSIVNQSFFFSTNIEWLFRFKHISKDIIPLHLAGLAVGYTGNGSETAYKQIFKVPPSSILEINKGKLSSSLYWFPKFETKITYKNKNDYYQHFIELFTHIVNENVQNAGIVASTLSSGLDSTFVTAIAAEILNKQNKPLIAITASPKYDDITIKSKNRYGNEIPLAKLVAKKYSNITHIIDKSIDTDPIDGLLKSIEIHSYPVRNASNQYWIISMFEKLKENNVNTLLIGQMGNLTYSWPFFNPKNIRSLWKNKIKKIIFSQSPYYIKNSYLSNTFIKQYKLLEYLKNSNYQPDYFSNNLTQIREYFFQQMQNTGYSSWNEKANHYGINIIDPTADVRLIEYCFSLPQNLFKNENGSRLFIRNAAKNILPDEILNNTKKAIQSADASKRLFDVLYKYNNLLNMAFYNPLTTTLFDIDLLKNNLKKKNISTHIFLRSLLIIFFIYFETNKTSLRTI